jgi:1-deoxy-D-xylulose-5-phosphate synthase
LQPSDDTPPFLLGKANRLLAAEGDVPDIALLAYGTPCAAAVEAAQRLRDDGHDPAVYDARFAKPVDLSLLRQLLSAGVPVLTIEDHLVDGGFGSAVLEVAAEAELDPRLIHRLGMPAAWVGPDSRAAQLRDAGLDAGGITYRARSILRVAPRDPDRVSLSV